MQVLIIHGRPMEEPSENKMALFNEGMISLYLYTLISLTNYNQDLNPVQTQCGLTLVGIILITIAVNLAKALLAIMKLVRRYFMRRALIKKMSTTVSIKTEVKRMSILNQKAIEDRQTVLQER
jgi:hypothetical protein